MKLYLSSYRIPDPAALFELAGKEPSAIKAAVIPNAKDYYADRARAVKTRSVTDYLHSFGMSAEVVDLQGFTESSAIINELSKVDMLWVMGGNTFCLMHEILRSGFDKALPELLETGIVYVGESAGAVVAGTSLKGIEAEDEPEFAESVVWKGMGLVPYFVLPHADDEHFQEGTVIARGMYKDSERLELTNAQAALFRDGDMRIVEKQL